jgi:hypothetical protein
MLSVETKAITIPQCGDVEWRQRKKDLAAIAVVMVSPPFDMGA